MNIAILAGGWHFPKHFYENAIKVDVPSTLNVDFYALCHRDMTKENHKEYLDRIDKLPENKLKKLDKVLYEDYADIKTIEALGWQAQLFPNTIGDFYFINQWLDTNPPNYDIIVYLSDDVYLLPEWKNFITDLATGSINVFEHSGYGWIPGKLDSNWIHIGNCPNGVRKVMRSSTGIFTGEFLSALGRFDMSKISLKREGKEDNKWAHSDVEEWNQVQRNLQDYMEEKNIDDLSYRLSPYYRISKYMIEAERGLLSNVGVFKPDYQKGIETIVDKYYKGLI